MTAEERESQISGGWLRGSFSPRPMAVAVLVCRDVPRSFRMGAAEVLFLLALYACCYSCLHFFLATGVVLKSDRFRGGDDRVV